MRRRIDALAAGPTALLLLVLSLISCSPKEVAINYGGDACDFCRMTIVEPQFASELVSSKGRAYKFDAVECLLSYENQHQETVFSKILVHDFENSTQFIDALKAWYVISPQRPSPMGAFLSAYASREEAEKTAAQISGHVLSWEDLNQIFEQGDLMQNQGADRRAVPSSQDH